MASSLVIEMLIKKREELMAELESVQIRIANEIREINASLVTLSGKPIPEIERKYRYDDENPDYIRGSQEEM